MISDLRLGLLLVRPPRIELGLRVPETLVISFSLRAPWFFLSPDCGGVNVPGGYNDAEHLIVDGTVGC